MSETQEVTAAKFESPREAGETATVADIIKDMADISKSTDFPISPAEAQRALNLFKSAIYAELEKGAKIQLVGFMSLTPAYRAARDSFNIATKQPLHTPEGVNILIKTGSKMREISRGYSPELVALYKSQRKSS